MVVDGESSGTTSVDSGVPQGSVLGPLLFLIYIDGIANTNLSPGSEISLYADDMMLFKVSSQMLTMQISKMILMV